jgi:uncharacterized protein involved in exopolysaccharide biosynthesis
VHDDLLQRLDETNRRIDKVQDDLIQRFDQTHLRIDGVRDELAAQVGEINRRLDRLYEVIVRREEHTLLDQRVANLERELAEIKLRIAA